MRTVFHHIEQVAGSQTTVFIRGESGVGKELVANAVHANSPRAKRAFLKASARVCERRRRGRGPAACVSGRSAGRARRQFHAIQTGIRRAPRSARALREAAREAEAA
jgi:hypothetical protein